MSDASDRLPKYATPEWLQWFRGMISDNCRRERRREYWRRFFGSWVADDPDPTYSAMDKADGLGVECDANGLQVAPHRNNLEV